MDSLGIQSEFVGFITIYADVEVNYDLYVEEQVVFWFWIHMEKPIADQF